MSDLVAQARELWNSDFSSLRSGGHPRTRAAFFAIETALTERIFAAGASGLLDRLVDVAVQPDGFVSDTYFSTVVSIVEALSRTYVVEWDGLSFDYRKKVEGVDWGLEQGRVRPFPVVVPYSHFVSKDEEIPLCRSVPGSGYVGFSDGHQDELIGFFRTVRHWLRQFRLVDVSPQCRCADVCYAEGHKIYGHEEGHFDESYYRIEDGERTDYDPVNNDYSIDDGDNETVPWHLDGEPDPDWRALTGSSVYVGESANVFSGGYVSVEKNESSSTGTVYHYVPTDCQYDDFTGHCVCEEGDFRFDEASWSENFSITNVHDVTLTATSVRDNRRTSARYWRRVEVNNPSLYSGDARTAVCSTYYRVVAADVDSMVVEPAQTSPRDISTTDSFVNPEWRYPIYSCSVADSVTVGTYSSLDYWSINTRYRFPGILYETWSGLCQELMVEYDVRSEFEPVDVDPDYNTTDVFQCKEVDLDYIVAMDTCVSIPEEPSVYVEALRGAGPSSTWPDGADNVLRYGLSVDGDCGARWQGYGVSGNGFFVVEVPDIEEPGDLGLHICPVAFGTPTDWAFTEFDYSQTDSAAKTVLIDYHGSFTFK